MEMKKILPPEKILLVDDVPANLSVLTAALEPAGYEILAVSDGATALKVAAKAQPGIILLDVMMPEMGGFEVCRRLKQNEATRDIPVIFITARNETKSLVAGFQAGGVDYVVKPIQAEEVVSRVATHLQISRLTHELQQKNLELQTEMERRSTAEIALKSADEKLSALSDLEASRWNLAGLIGSSGAVRRIIDDIHRLHQFANTSVLITGESGTGKELIARAIHFESPRAKAPFIPVNCVAIPSELAESMLFGHVKGAFTGATTDRKGYFELAHGGAIFLDEIGDMPVSLQVKLLRVLEDGCVTPVGSAELIKVDVRVIAATNADLATRIAAGSFRQDLYFRLARYTVATPPLRERLEDVPVLVSHFLQMFAAEMGMKAPPISDDALAVLKRYNFPGNVRELKNIVERALIDSGSEMIERRHLHLLPSVSSVASGTSSAKQNAKTEFVSSLPVNLAEAEDILIQRALQETDGNIANAARMLGVHRTRIYRKLAQEEPEAGN
jgi:DNA-binding NtrC family response regulator